MKSLSRFLILAVFFLVSAAALPAQHFISAGSGPSFTFNSGFVGAGGYCYSDFGWGGDFGGWGFSDFGLRHPGEHAPFSVGFAHGDSDFQQSEYMDFDQAVALGKKILAEQTAPKPSLGDIVRTMHLRPNTSPAKTGPLVLLQDYEGKPFVCRTLTRTAAIPSSVAATFK